jgi:hypothetical protein
MIKSIFLSVLIILIILISPYFIHSASAQENNSYEKIISELLAQIVQMETVLKKNKLSLESQKDINIEISEKENLSIPKSDKEPNIPESKESEEISLQYISTEESIKAENNTVNTTYECLKINRVMRPEDYQDDVIKLQEFLHQRGHFFHPHITKYFGPVTKKAVQDFQRAEGIVSQGTPQTTGFGQVGPLTIKKIEEITCSTDDSNFSNI